MGVTDDDVLMKVDAMHGPFAPVGRGAPIIGVQVVLAFHFVCVFFFVSCFVFYHLTA